MYRLISLSKLCLIFCFAGFILQSAACGDNNTTEPTQEKTTPDAAEKAPEKAPKEEAPEQVGPPAGVGEKCRSGGGGRHNCPGTGLACVITDSTNGICFESCTSGECSQKDEICKPYSGSFKACFKLANKGEACSIETRTTCREDSVEPPEYCIQGKCTARPKDGWGEGQNCSPSGGSEQSDCKAGLACVSLASNLFKCVKTCTADADCPTGKKCWEEPLNKKVCLTAAKIGDSCDRLNFEFCYTDDKVNKPVKCDTSTSKCVSASDKKAVGEDCAQSFDPTNKQGNCEQGLVCLGVTFNRSMCYKACTAAADCTNGEVCTDHPNDGEPIKACVIAAKKDELCDLTKRRLCVGASGQLFRCKPHAENDPEGKCVEVNIGDACEGDAECGNMACVAPDSSQAQKRYCLTRCNPQNIQCPGNGACVDAGGTPVCIPVGPKKEDEACTGPQVGGAKLNTSNSCVGGLNCVTFKQGNPAGVCMKGVAQCTAGACDSKHTCVPLQNKTGICGRTCAGNGDCLTDTICTEVSQGVKVCGPKI